MTEHNRTAANSEQMSQYSGLAGTSRVNVLQVQIGGHAFTGISNYLYQQYKAIDRKKVHFDFLFTNKNAMESVMGDPVFADSLFYTLEARIGKDLCNDFLKILHCLRKIIREHRYDIVVVNSSNLEIAATCKAALANRKDIVFITHAHNASFDNEPKSIRTALNMLTKLIDACCRRTVVRKSAYLFACTETAGRYTFGNSVVHQPNFIRIKNAIHSAPFRPNETVRKKVRSETGSGENTLVFGGGGRLIHNKNLIFLLRIFDELRRIHPDSRLWLLGNGREKEALVAQAKTLGLEQHVTFWGQRSDVPDLMQAMDAFIFPSVSEGLGIIAIEAQAAGLPTVISDGVPDDTMITPQADKVPLSASPEKWAEAVLEQIHAFPDRYANAEAFSRSGYDISDEAKKITELYIRIASENQQ